MSKNGLRYYFISKTQKNIDSSKKRIEKAEKGIEEAKKERSIIVQEIVKQGQKIAQEEENKK